MEKPKKKKSYEMGKLAIHTGWKIIDWPSFGCGSSWLSRSLVQVLVGMW